MEAPLSVQQQRRQQRQHHMYPGLVIAPIDVELVAVNEAKQYGAGTL